MVSLVLHQRLLADTTVYRANKSNEVGTPSEPSLSAIQSLSELRLTHARLLEEHGANIAILRSREAELARTNESLSETQGMMGTLQGEVQLLKDKVARREQRAQLAEREVGFLQALVVRANGCLQYHFLIFFQASFTAEDQASREVSTSDGGLSQRIHQLEQSLSEYKAVNAQLQKALDVIDGEEGAEGARLSRKELRQRMEYHKGASEEATKGNHSFA